MAAVGGRFRGNKKTLLTVVKQGSAESDGWFA